MALRMEAEVWICITETSDVWQKTNENITYEGDVNIPADTANTTNGIVT
jgi:hypothetical protein